MIVKEILKNIKSLTFENKKNSILIGVSGGVDSVFLVDVISKLNKHYKWIKFVKEIEEKHNDSKLGKIRDIIGCH